MTFKCPKCGMMYCVNPHTAKIFRCAWTDTNGVQCDTVINVTTFEGRMSMAAVVLVPVYDEVPSYTRMFPVENVPSFKDEYYFFRNLNHRS